MTSISVRPSVCVYVTTMRGSTLFQHSCHGRVRSKNRTRDTAKAMHFVFLTASFWEVGINPTLTVVSRNVCCSVDCRLYGGSRRSIRVPVCLLVGRTVGSLPRSYNSSIIQHMHQESHVWPSGPLARRRSAQRYGVWRPSNRRD